MNRWTAPSIQLPQLLELLLCLSSALLISQTLADDQTCKQPTDTGKGVASCMCQTNTGGIIDLNPLANTGGSAARFAGVKDDDVTQKYDYTYNPCLAYTDSKYTQCKNVHVCQISTETGGSVYGVGDSSESILYDQAKKKYYASYTRSGGGGDRNAKVYLNCDQGTDGKITSVKQTTQDGVHTLYTLQLSSCHACPGGCVAVVAPGIIGLVIIFLIPVVLVIYFVVGALVMKYHYHAEGTDIIPNKSLWLALPILIKDGCLFTFSPCVNFVRSRRNDYQKI